ncbi:hypothetical protein Avbf_06826 [Armadillidium vulgare]|nr:hypothetical protein Avbf_06826 [Armadillidium vulgare]
MDMKRFSLTNFVALVVIVSFFSSGVSAFTFERASSGQRHIMVKRSEPSQFHNIPHHKPHFEEGLQQPSAFEDAHHRPNIRHDGHGSHHPSIKEEKEREKALKMALGEEGLTRVVYDDDQTYTDDDDDYYYDALLPLTNGYEDDDEHKKKVEEVKEHKKPTEIFPKKFSPNSKEKKTLEKKHEPHTKIILTDIEDEMKTHHIDHSEEEKEDSLPSNPGKHPKKNSNPLVLPVTTEGKQKTEDPLIVYGFPKELLPIMPGGGSRFEDVEREKLEKKKMSPNERR